jgi:hypothetical protein
VSSVIIPLKRIKLGATEIQDHWLPIGCPLVVAWVGYHIGYPIGGGGDSEDSLSLRSG